MKSLIRKILFGDAQIKEYSTVTVPGDILEKVYLKIGEHVFDVSVNHFLLCLEPIVFGVWFSNKESSFKFDTKTACNLYFSDSSYEDFKKTKRKAVAVATLDYMDKIEEPDGTLYLLRLKKCEINHLSFWKTFLLFFKYYKKPKLSFEKYRSLVASYSYPRKVRIISFKEGDYFNIFPMDLLGKIPQSNKHVFGLRHTNVALPKIIETKRMVASEISHTYKDIIYELGKHHSGSPPSIDSLPFKVIRSERFGFYIPEWTDSYKEIKILTTKNLGSHMLLWGEIVNEKTLRQPSANLYHIHFLHYYHQKLKGLDYPIV